MNRFLPIVFFILFPVLMQAQTMSDGGTFQIAGEPKGCAPLTITLGPFLDPTKNCISTPCGIDYEGDGFTDELSHEYTTPGTYDLIVYYQGGAVDQIQIEVTENVAPDYNVYVCDASQVFFEITDNRYDRYYIDFGDGNSTEVNPGTTGTHTYASSGTYDFEVMGFNLDAERNCNSRVTQVNVAPLTVPSIDRIEVLPNNDVQLNFTTEPNVLYRLMIAVNGASPNQRILDVHNRDDVTLTNLNPEANYYCFQLVPFNRCTGTPQTVLASNIVCSVRFNATAADGENLITWSTDVSGGQTVALHRNGEPFYSGLPPSWTDSEIICGDEYQYQLIVTGSSSTSYSSVKTVTAFSTATPASIRNISTVVNETAVNLEWTQDPDFVPLEYTIYKSLNGNDYRLLGTSGSVTFIDNSYTTESAICYQIDYSDRCGNRSDLSVEACPILLTGDLNRDNTINLTWSAYTGWENGVQAYTVEKYSYEGQLIDSFDAGANTTLVDNGSDDNINQAYVYVVIAIPNESNVNPSVSNTVLIVKEPNIYYPTAFTPNNDNLNDTFRVYGQYIVDFEMQIFNRWGELVFTSNDISHEWDGTFRGKPMPEGSYTIVAKITDLAGRIHERSGSIVLLKKR